ncbi:MAG: pyridoxal-phosphate dependent enzyme, partial [Verrucomicrobiota bacterium]|nr:pyridoxal-phosphate dependent enzyme [Verrucomicrobiota bacterium]
YREYADAGHSDTLPRMMGFQAAGAAPFVEDAFIDNPETIASAIRIGKPASWQPAKAALQFSAGAIDKVTDEEILTAYQMITAQEGIFVEPASAAALAGIIKLQNAGKIDEGSIVVATMTGHGLKDPDNAVEHANVEATTVEATLDAVKAAIGI